MPSWCSRTCYGPISRRSISPPLWRNTGGGNGGSGHALSDTASRWNDLSRRIKTALVLVPIALSCVWLGGVAFLVLMGAAIAVVAVEWARMCGHGGSHMSMAWMIVVLMGAAILG